ncbi:hypothetical protein D3C72_894640 [compost metagenome]
MHGTDARAGEHRHGGFRHHRHINGDHIAFFDALFKQHVGKTTDVAVQLFISNVFALRGVVAFPDNGGLIAALGQMAVQTVRCKVQRAVFIPFDGDVAWRKRGVFHLLIRRDPVKNFALLTPEGIRVRDRLLVLFLVLLRIYQAMVRNICGNVVFVNLAHGFCSPFRMLIICRKNVNCRGFDSFVCYLGDRSRIK